MKIITGALTSLLLGTGALVAAAPAQAAPYPHTVATSCSVTAPQSAWLEGDTVVVNANVRAGNGSPTGTVRVNGVAGGEGARAAGRLPVGSHTVSMSYEPGATSVFKPCAAAVTVRVMERDRRGMAVVAMSKYVAAVEVAKAAKQESAKADTAAKRAQNAAKRAAKAVKKAKTPAAKAEAKRVAKAASAVAKAAASKAKQASKVANKKAKAAKKAKKAAKKAKRRARRG